MRKFGQELIESMKQAARHAEGRKVSGLRITTVEVPDVKAIRQALRMSQQRFAATYRIPLATIKNWEQKLDMVCSSAPYYAERAIFASRAAVSQS